MTSKPFSSLDKVPLEIRRKVEIEQLKYELQVQKLKMQELESKANIISLLSQCQASEDFSEEELSSLLEMPKSSFQPVTSSNELQEQDDDLEIIETEPEV